MADRVRLADSRAHAKAAARLMDTRGSIYKAFDGLDCGFDHEQALDYLESTPSFESLHEDVRAKVFGMILGFALVAVEAERDPLRLDEA